MNESLEETLDRYLLRVAPTLRPRTVVSKRSVIRNLIAYSGGFRTRIPIFTEHGFRKIPNADSGVCRTRIPGFSEHDKPGELSGS